MGICTTEIHHLKKLLKIGKSLIPFKTLSILTNHLYLIFKCNFYEKMVNLFIEGDFNQLTKLGKININSRLKNSKCHKNIYYISVNISLMITLS